jgi:hypothetical protein
VIFASERIHFRERSLAAGELLLETIFGERTLPSWRALATHCKADFASFPTWKLCIFSRLFKYLPIKPKYSDQHLTKP